MKKLLKSMLIACLCLGMVSMTGCSSKEETPEVQTTVDLSGYPADFASWNMGDMKKYLEDANITTNQDYILMDLSENEVVAIGCDGAFMYVDANEGKVMDIFIFFDASKPESKEKLDAALQNKAIIPEGADQSAAMAQDAIIGGFCFSYGLGMDEDHIASLVKVLKELTDYYQITDAFILE